MRLNFAIVAFFFLLTGDVLMAQNISISEPLKEDSRDMNFEIVGKVSGNIIIFKDVKYRYAINVYNDSMQLKEKVELDFLPNKVFNADHVAYADHFYLIYQYQKKTIVYCMAVKMNGEGKKQGEPFQLDSTEVGNLGDNRIYATSISEDKKKLMIYKIQRKEDKLNFATKLFDNQFNLLQTGRIQLDYEENRNVLSDFMLDNDGNFVFTLAGKKSNREFLSSLVLIKKPANEEKFHYNNIALGQSYIDEVKLKVDNFNKKYILCTFYYADREEGIDGLLINIWDAKGDSLSSRIFTAFDENLRSVAKSSGNARYAFDDFFIRNIVLRKDGSFMLHAEDHTTQTNGVNNWNRNDFMFNSPFFTPYDYYWNPGLWGAYRPFGTFNQQQNTRFYYENILLLGIDKTGMPAWTNLIHKQQFADDNDNHLSYSSFVAGGEVHFLFNDISKREKLLSDNIISADGSARRSPTLRTYDSGYEFMPRFARQIAARSIIIPCTFRGQLCFAKVDF